MAKHQVIKIPEGIVDPKIKKEFARCTEIVQISALDIELIPFA